RKGRHVALLSSRSTSRKPGSPPIRASNVDYIASPARAPLQLNSHRDSADRAGGVRSPLATSLREDAKGSLLSSESVRVSEALTPLILLAARRRDVVLHSLLGAADLRNQIVEVGGPVDEVDLVRVDDQERGIVVWGEL